MLGFREVSYQQKAINSNETQKSFSRLQIPDKIYFHCGKVGEKFHNKGACEGGL